MWEGWDSNSDLPGTNHFYLKRNIVITSVIVIIMIFLTYYLTELSNYGKKLQKC